MLKRHTNEFPEVSVAVIETWVMPKGAKNGERTDELTQATITLSTKVGMLQNT